jgi:transglutaminase-like putative cysteine protease
MQVAASIRRAALLGALLLAAWVGAAPLTDPQLLALLRAAPGPQAYPHDDAVWLLRDIDITVEPSGALVVRERKLLKILTPEGLRLANWEIPYDKAAETLEVRTARTLVGDVQYPVEPGQVTENAQYPGWAWYDSLTTRRFPLPGAVVGAVLEVETVFRRPTPRMPDEFSARLPLQQALPVREAHGVVRVPPAMRLAVRFTGLPAPAVNERDEKGRHVYAWLVRDLPALKITEPQTPPADELVATVRLSSLPGWEPVVAWYTALTAGKDALTDDLRAVAARLTRGCDTDDAKIAALHTAVRALPYIAVEMGNLSDVPHDADAVMRRNYGDCKDKATLLRALLKAVGIASDYVLVRTADRGTLDRRLYGPSEFNHVILAVRTPAGDRFLDATIADVPATLLPPEVEGAEALIVRDKGVLTTLPASTAAANRTEIAVTATVKPDGSAAGRAVLTFRGQSAVLQRGMLTPVPADRYREALEGVLGPRLGNEVVVQAVTVRDLRTPEVPLVLEVAFTSAAYLQAAAEGWSGQLPVFAYQQNRFRTVTTRVFPYRQRLENGLHLTAAITLPAGWQVTGQPAPVAYDGPCGSFSDSLAVDGATLTYTCDLATKRGTLPSDRLDDLRRWAALLAYDGRNGLLFFVKKP